MIRTSNPQFSASRRRLAALALFAALPVTGVSAQPDPSGVEFVTIGSPNNPAYQREDLLGVITGRGSVPYEYRMGKYEITSGEWLAFYNTFKARPDAVSDSVLPPPIIWGGQVDPTYTGPGRRYRLDPSDPNAGRRFAAGISWRAAAMLCNWYSNSRGNSISDIQNGAYDTSTFQEPMTGVFTDQVTRNTGARYWVSSLDEWAKASFFDPHANGNAGGWWLFPFGSDTRPIYAPPPSLGGNGQANTFFQLPGMAQFRIPLGAYAEVGSQTPWGLLDTAGATSEWTEERVVDDFNHQVFRYYGGSASLGSNGDLAWSYGADSPTHRGSHNGFRIASAIPGPSTWASLCLKTAFAGIAGSWPASASHES